MHSLQTPHYMRKDRIMKRKTAIDLIWQILLAVAIVVADRAMKLYIIANCTTGEVFGEIPYIADFLYVICWISSWKNRAIFSISFVLSR